jgi:AP endonuclease 2
MSKQLPLKATRHFLVSPEHGLATQVIKLKLCTPRKISICVNAGVATLCRSEIMPVRAEEGLTGQLVPPNCTDSVGCSSSSNLTTDRLKLLDSEGRALITQFKLKVLLLFVLQHICIAVINFMIQDGTMLSIINVYCPRADPDRYEERLSFKLDFYQLLEDRAQALRTAGSHVVVLGDLNTSHKPIDHCDPGDLVNLIPPSNIQ